MSPRPLKIVVSFASSAGVAPTADGADAAPARVPARRGRKPKVAADAGGAAPRRGDDAGAGAPAATGVVVVKVPAKRGRPPKVRPDVVVPTRAAATEQAEPKAKRGRKPKPVAAPSSGDVGVQAPRPRGRPRKVKAAEAVATASEISDAVDPISAAQSIAPLTLCIDIGGTGLKALVIDNAGHAVTERVRVETPRPATTDAILRALLQLVAPIGAFDRISVGFPGVVHNGVTKTAPNLDVSWQGFALGDELQELLGKPTRVLNDAGVQGFGVIEGQGLEMVLTLGTGMGCALFIDGRYVPNLELAHHPFRKGKTYEEFLGAKALEKVGKKEWNKRLKKALDQIDPIWNPRLIYLGGGNAKNVRIELPQHVKLVSNVAGLLGGIALWRM